MDWKFQTISFPLNFSESLWNVHRPIFHNSSVSKTLQNSMNACEILDQKFHWIYFSLNFPEFLRISLNFSKKFNAQFFLIPLFLNLSETPWMTLKFWTEIFFTIRFSELFWIFLNPSENSTGHFRTTYLSLNLSETPGISPKLYTKNFAQALFLRISLNFSEKFDV